MVNTKEFSKRLHLVMEYHQLSASGFADAIHVGRSSISHILSGRNKPSLEFVMKIVEAFPEVTLYWLLNGKGNFPKSAEPESKKEENTTPIQNIVTEKVYTKDTDLFSNLGTNQKSNPENPIFKEKINFVDNKRTIARIVIFYTDGSFEDYLSKN